jgi:O-antigen/teichoic acid export membrane protein
MVSSGLARRLSVDTLHAASGRFATLVLWLLFTPAIWSTLGADRFAIWSLFFALTGYFAALDLGLAQGTLRFVAAARGRDDHHEAGSFATLALSGYLVLSACWILLVAGFSSPLVQWLRIPAELVDVAKFGLWVGALVFFLSGVSNVIMATLQGYGRFDLANVVLLTIAFQQAAGMAMILSRGWGLHALMINVAIGGALGTLVGLVILARAVPEFRWARLGRVRRAMPEALRFGIPLQITNVLAVVNAQIDKLLLSRFTGLSAVSAYELGSRVGAAATSLPQLLLLPIMAESARMAASGEPDRLRQLYERGSRYFLTAGSVIVAALLAGASRLYSAWLGSPHPEAALVLQWLVVAMFFTLATGMATTLARGIGKPGLETGFALVTVTLHVGLSLALLPRMGLAGALVASVVSHAIGSLLFMLLFARFLRWPIARVVLKPWAIPALAVLVGWVAGHLLDRTMPIEPGLPAWGTLAAVTAVAVLAATVTTTVTRYFHWDEALQLLLGPRAGGRRGGSR